MRVGIYIAYASLKGGGSFTYALGLIRSVQKIQTLEKIILIISPDQVSLIKENGFYDNQKIEIVIDTIQRNKFKNLLFKIYRTISYNNIIVLDEKYQEEKLNIFNPYKKYIEGLNISILHVPYQISPVYRIKAKVIVTLHDVQELHYPEYFSPVQRIKRALAHGRSAKLADAIVVSYNHIKKDIEKYFPGDVKKAYVCQLNFFDEWFLGEVNSEQENVRRKYSLPEDYILYPAATWAHKNHETLIKSLGILKNKGLKINCIFTGNQSEYINYLNDFIKNEGLENQIKFLGIVPQQDLVALYKNCKFVVIPSLYEAGSGPMYEAIRYNVPVISSDATILPEVLGDDRFIFKGNEAEELAEKITLMFSNQEFYNANKLNVLKQNEVMKNHVSHNSFYKIYNNLLMDNK